MIIGITGSEHGNMRRNAMIVQIIILVPLVTGATDLHVRSLFSYPRFYRHGLCKPV